MIAILRNGDVVVATTSRELFNVLGKLNEVPRVVIKRGKK